MDRYKRKNLRDKFIFKHNQDGTKIESVQYGDFQEISFDEIPVLNVPYYLWSCLMGIDTPNVVSVLFEDPSKRMKVDNSPAVEMLIIHVNGDKIDYLLINCPERDKRTT